MFMVFQGCFNGVSMEYNVGFKDVLKKFKGCSRSFMNVSQKFSGWFKEVLMVFQGSFKVDSRKF